MITESNDFQRIGNIKQNEIVNYIIIGNQTNMKYSKL